MKKVYTHSLIYSLLFMVGVACGQVNNSSSTVERVKDAKVDTPITNFTEKEYYDFGRKKMSIGAYQEAIGLFSKAIQKNPNYLSAYLERAYCYQEMSFFSKAIEDIQIVLGKDNKNTLAYNNLGNVYADNSNPKKAIECYNKAIEISPSFGRAYYNRGYTYNELGKKKKACADWKKAAKLGDKDAKLNLEKYCK